MAFTSGLRELENLGISNIEELKKHDNIVLKKFLKCCHKGYDKSQRRIVEEIVRLTNLKKQKLLELKESRKKHCKQSLLNLKSLIIVIDNRIIVLRRIIDTIAFTLFKGKTWIGRRFCLLEGIKKIDTNAILSNIKEANLLNEQDRLKLAIVCDLTTFIDVGDLLQVDFHKQPAEWRLIELKERKVNKILEEILDRADNVVEEERVKEVINEISPYAMKQAERMMRQKNRINEIYTILEKNEGIDIGMKMPIVLNEKEILTSHYDEALNKVIEIARMNGQHVVIIDKCLKLIAVNNSSDHAYHLLYHLLSPERDCAFTKNNIEEIKNEIKEMHSKPFAQDLTLSNMYSRSSTPFFLFPLSSDDMLDLLYNRMSLIAYLDIRKFMELGSDNGFKVGLHSGKETHDILSKFGHRHVPMCDGRAIWVKLSDGMLLTLLSGTFTRIFHDLLRPSELFRIWNIPIKKNGLGVSGKMV